MFLEKERKKSSRNTACYILIAYEDGTIWVFRNVDT